MGDHTRFERELRALIVASTRRALDERGPATFDGQDGEFRMLPNRRAQRIEIPAKPIPDRRLKCGFRREDPGKSQLDRRRDGQIGIGCLLYTSDAADE